MIPDLLYLINSCFLSYVYFNLSSNEDQHFIVKKKKKKQQKKKNNKQLFSEPGQFFDMVIVIVLYSITINIRGIEWKVPTPSCKSVVSNSLPWRAVCMQVFIPTN